MIPGAFRPLCLRLATLFLLAAGIAGVVRQRGRRSGGAAPDPLESCAYNDPRHHELLRMAIENARVGLWNWDIPADRIHWNRIEYEQCGVPPGSPVNLGVFTGCIHPEDRELMRAEIEGCLRDGRELNLEHRILWADGTVRWNWCKGRIRYRDGKPIGMSGMSLDITPRKDVEAALEQARAALARHAAELEQRVADRTGQLQATVKDLEDFCYSMAHDLRAPLRAMSGLTRALVLDYGPGLDETAQDYCARIDAAAKRMDQLIADLLAYGRLAQSQVTGTPVNLMDEIEKVLQRTALQIQEKHAEIEVDGPLPSVWGDATTLDQALENLVSNAIKFVPPGRQPHVHIFAQQKNERVLLCVEDNGIGIPAEHRQRIFKPFERLHATGVYPGTGMGLAIVQRSIQKMGGQVRVEPAPGQGSRFWIELTPAPEK